MTKHCFESKKEIDLVQKRLRFFEVTVDAFEDRKVHFLILKLLKTRQMFIIKKRILVVI